VYGVSDVNPSRVHITVPKDARLRRRTPKWIVVHRGELLVADVMQHEGLPVTTVGQSVLQVFQETGRLGLAGQAVKDARKEGHISVADANRLARELNRDTHCAGETQTAKEPATA
jgi:predicted transcriptional regulator of viral defense system